MEGFEVTGPRFLFEVFGLRVSETLVTQWLVMLVLIVVAYLISRNLKLMPETKSQHVAEIWVTACRSLVEQAMEKKNLWFTPYVIALLPFIFLCNIIGMLGIFKSPTADLNTTLGLALMTFALIHGLNIHFNGFGSYIKGYFAPMFFLFPLNITGELAKPISLSFRLFGNLLGGSIIMSLIYAALPAVLNVGIPIVFHIYFDLFAGFLQAFIFSILTMVFVAIAIGD